MVREFGDAPEVVDLTEIEIPGPGEGQVLVEMLASAINPSDLITISGAYRSRVALPFLPGFEGVGVVRSIGPGVTDLAVGTRVLPIGTAGSWSSHKLSESRWCFPVSDSLSEEQAATMYVNPLTAWLMLHDSASIDPGMTVIVDAAGSEIGRMLLALLNRAGVEPVAIVRSASSANGIEGFATKAVLVSSAPRFEEELDRACPDRPDLVLDSVGGELGSVLRSRIAPGGRFIHYGLLSGEPLTPLPTGSAPDHRFEFFRLRDWVHRVEPTEIQAGLDRVGGLIAEGVIETRVDSTHALGRIDEALARHGDPGRNGKVLLRA
ncbi:MAG TPA: zinc-dependent alcohol dehydrogenase family protein [Solirubrobacterales bacterium]|nr:zinc-dependent alcohol dehydrogenase family protein [Solirubrobacterales bacterium]